MYGKSFFLKKELRLVTVIHFVSSFALNLDDSLGKYKKV